MFRIVPSYRFARRSFSRDVSPWGYWENWSRPIPFRHRRWGHPMMLPFFGHHHPVNRLLLYNLNRIGETVGSFWFDDWDEEAEVKSDKRTSRKNNAATSFGQEISQTEEACRSDVFSVSLNVGDALKPDEITVTVVGRSLHIRGNHEERGGEDGHYVNRSFAHSYILPPDVADDANFTSKLTAEGILSVVAPRLQVADVKNERSIPVTREDGGDGSATDISDVDSTKSEDLPEAATKDADYLHIIHDKEPEHHK